MSRKVYGVLMVSGNATMAARSITYSPLPKRLEALQRSASVLPNNLAVQRDSKREVCGYAVAHRSEVVIVRWDETGACKQTVIEPFPRSDELDSLTFVTGMKWCKLQDSEPVFVITSFAGFVVLNFDASSRLFQYRLTHRENSQVSSCTRGITSSCNNVFVGTSEGFVLVFSVSPNFGVEFRQQLGMEGDPPISCLAADDDGRVAAGNEVGDVVVWRDPSASRAQEKMTIFNGESRGSCTQVQWWKDLIAMSYSNGQISICSPDRGLRLIDANAHSRWINGLDIAPKTGLILTFSEDSTFSVWKLSGNSKQPKLSLVYNGLIENCLLTGGEFCDPQGTTLSLTSYDSNVIMEYGQALSP